MRRRDRRLYRCLRVAMFARCLGCVLACSVLARGQDGVSAPTESVAQPILIPVADQTTVVVARSRVIAWNLEEPAISDFMIEPTCEPPGMIEFLRPFEALAGHKVGYLRLRALMPGSATIRVGESAMIVHVRPEGGIPSPFENRPRIVSPVEGAAIWGVVGVGVEVFDPSGPIRSAVRLRLSSGEILEPVSETPPGMGPHRRVVFQVDADALPAGDAFLTAVVAQGMESEPLGVRVIRPESVIAMEAEGEHEVARPRRFGPSIPAQRLDGGASGGACVVNASAYPPVCFPVRAEVGGRYQVILRVSGDMAGGALPIVALHAGDDEYPRTSAQLVSERWHRLAIGAPIMLDAGEHAITAMFMNDFYVPGLADRNLRIDSIEIARVDERVLANLPRLSLARTGDAFMDARRGAMEMMVMGGAMSAGGGMGDGTGGSFEIEDRSGVRMIPLRVAFDRVFEGRSIAGELEVRGIVFAEGSGESRDPRDTPMVSLLVNGREVGRQRTLAPRFFVDAGEFVAGENTIRLIARLDAGLEASTPTQRLAYTIPAGTEPAKARAMHRFSIRDERWDDFTRQRLAARSWPGERLACALMSEGTARLALPAEFGGEFELAIVALGEEFEGPPMARVELEVSGQRVTIGEAGVGGWWQTLPMGRVTLAEGEKSLLVSFINDRYEAARGDRNLIVESVILRDVRDTPEAVLPIGRIAHPSSGEAIWRGDALVAHVGDNAGVAWCELLIDGRATGIRERSQARDGLVVLAIPARALSTGEHAIALRVGDTSGNVVDLEGVVVNVLGVEPEGGTEHARAVHALRRFGFGVDDRQLARVLEVGTRAWLSEQIAMSSEGDAEAAALGAALVRFPDVRSAYEVGRRGVHHAMRTHSPARARLVLWVDNLFSTWVRKIEGEREWSEHRRFARSLDAPFADLLMTSATSPAMLAYLDQDQSFAGRINENYAREIMELHTLGADGGYDQGDVGSLARLLTGWSAGAEGDPLGGGLSRVFRFRFDPALNDPGEGEVLGVRFASCGPEGRFDRALHAIETLTAHPSAGEHVARRLCEHYVGVPAPDDLVDSIARVYFESGGDLREMLLALHDHDAFWRACRDGRLASALDYGLALARLSEDDDNPWRIADFLQRSGRQVFDRPTPDGYPEQDSEQADTNAMIQRWSLAHDMRWLLASLVPDPIRYGDPERIPGWDQLVVDLLAMGICGETLGDRSNEAALEYLGEAEGTPPERVLALAPFVAQLSEANLR